MHDATVPVSGKSTYICMLSEVPRITYSVPSPAGGPKGVSPRPFYEAVGRPCSASQPRHANKLLQVTLTYYRHALVAQRRHLPLHHDRGHFKTRLTRIHGSAWHLLRSTFMTRIFTGCYVYLRVVNFQKLFSFLFYVEV